ncbi:hypothetical protein BDZ89DRAFT_1163101 [Hymenopellis radicata]|nr:hypothetical protein BDZ89DRAFT_1163101 [Hymenopellis radicata]
MSSKALMSFILYDFESPLSSSHDVIVFALMLCVRNIISPKLNNTNTTDAYCPFPSLSGLVVHRRYKSPSPTHRQKLFTYNPPPIQRASRMAIPSAPLQLLDHHISASLILKRVQIVPELHIDLTAALDLFSSSLDLFNDSYFSFSRGFYEDKKGAGALSLIKARRRGVDDAAVQVASSLLLHPNQPEVLALPMWRDALYELQSTMIHEQYASQNLTLHLLKPAEEQISALNRKNRTLYERLRKHIPQLTSCVCFCADALPLLEDMARLETIDAFPWQLHSRCEASFPHSPSTIVDAPKSLWTLPKTTAPRRSSRLRQTSTTLVRPKGDIHLVDKLNKEGGYRPRCEDYIQKAWATAVKVDASLIMFDCGNFLRFGIRHRQSQTLFLSDLIDVCTCRDPSYGRLLTALTVAAVYDAVMRLPSLENTVLGKRKSDNTLPNRRSKRLKNDTDAAIRALDIAMHKELESSSVLAVSFRLDHFDSPAPLLLFPPEAERNPCYKPSEYLMITVDKKLGAGAVGDVYRAIIEPTKSSTADYRPFVLKIASSKASVRRLRHEVRVYRHLLDAGVLGIPLLLGFRENAEADVCVLMLSDAGRPLGCRMDSNKKVELLPDERLELISILKGIHDAGVLHRDVRSWNIMQDELGRLRFADFDRASLCAKDSDYVAEKERLEEFVGGAFIDKARIIGVDDL